MIDTIKFRIEADDSTLSKIRAKSVEFKGYDHENEKISYQIFKKSVNIGSFFYGVALTVSDDCFFIEFSVPKYAYNHNILLFPVEQLSDVIDKVHRDLQKYFCCKIAQPIYWELYRLDLCYAWKFYNDQTAQKVIQYIRNQNFKRKKSANYGTSCMFVGSDYSLKFYMKGPEFYAHDYKRLKLSSYNDATNLLVSAEGVVRFEITLRHAQLLRTLKLPDKSLNVVPLLTRSTIIEILRSMLHTLIGVSTTTMSTMTAYDLLRKQLKGDRAREVYFMYRAYTSVDPVDRSIFDSLPRTTRFRYKQVFKRFRLGIPEEVADTEVSLTIPSPYGVGEFQSP